MELNIKKDTVYTFKMNSGEELIAKVSELGNGYVAVIEPLSVAPGPQGMGLIPSLFTSSPQAETRLNTLSIALVSETDDSVKMKYLEATTGIKVPEKKLILG